LTVQNSKKIRLIMHLRQSGIMDTNVLSAIERIPREQFIHDKQADIAWDDIAVKIACGQTISQPFVVAKMTEALELTDRHKVLEIGTGSGYQACILSKLCRRVYTIERHKPLLEGAEKMFADLHIRNITAICADGMKGWPKIHGIDQAPFDRIIVTAAAREAPPTALIDQLVVGGIMIIPVGPPGEQALRRYYKESDEVFSYRDIMPVRFVPLLPNIASKEEAAKEEVAA